MKTTKIIAIFFLILQLSLFAGVPYPRTHNPALPYFMEQINFQPVLLNVYGSNISGVIPNQYSDLNWNPAFILQASGNSAYLDFNYQTPYTNVSLPSYNSEVRPTWYGNTHITPLQLNPLYNFAIVHKINDKISIGIVNRTIFDYGPFRSSSRRRSYSGSSFLRGSDYDRTAYEKLKLQTAEVDDNQQSVLGIQTQFTLGYNLSSKIDIGLKLGHYIFRQNGELGDSRYSKQPHSLIDEDNSENLNINGDQYEMGAGVIYHYNNTTDLGIYASFMSGNSTETNVVAVNTENWSERPTDSKYYNIGKYNLASNYSFSSDGTSPFISLTFQKKLSKKLTFRTFFSYRYTSKELASTVVSTDTSYSELTYDSYENSNNRSYFTKSMTSGRAKSTLNGQGDETSKTLKWFASLIYKTDKNWSAFAAIMLGMQNREVSSFEKSTYYDNRSSERYFYVPETNNNLRSHIKNYQYNYTFTEWSAIVPIGIKAHIYGGLSCLIGTDLQFSIINAKKSGDLLYPERISRWVKNGTVTNEDIEKNRPEIYTSNKPTTFNKNSNIYVGAFYEHQSGLKLYIKTEGDIFNKSYWTFGVGYAY